MLSCMKVALWHLKSWKGSARAIVVIVLSVIITVYQSMEYIGYAKEIDGIINCFETYILVINNGVHSIVMFILTLVLFADAPFMDNNSLYVVSRIGRYRWCIGKILYIVIATVIINLVCLVTTVIVSLPYSFPGDIWSSTFMGVLDGHAVKLNYQAYFDNKEIVYMFNPMKVALISMGLKVMLNIAMGMMLFVLNIINGKVLGYAVVSILYFAELTVSGQKIAKFMFEENSILAMQTGVSDLRWSMIYFGGIIIVCSIVSLIMISKIDYKIALGERV